MPKLTKRITDAILAAHDGRDQFHWDDALPGFGLRVNPSGSAGWLIQYRTLQGRTRRLTLGSVGILTPDEARRRARIELGKVEAGGDPSGDRQMARRASTVAQLCEDYLISGVGRIKASTLAMDRSRIERHVKPLLGSRTVESLTIADIERFLRDVESGKTAQSRRATSHRGRGGVTTGGSGVASRTVGMLGTILERAVRDGSIQRNPVRGVRRPADKPKKPPFSFDLVAAIGKAMREAHSEHPSALAAIRLLLLTGCRRMEILGLKWAYVDVYARCFRFPDSKSGAQMRPIGRAAIDTLNALPREEGAVYVLPAARGARHFVGLPRAWERICATAGVDGVSIHGLRHWLGSAAAELNYSELTIAGMLGHRVRGVTARYANVPDSAVHAAADKVSARLAHVLDGHSESAGVVDLGTMRRAPSA